MESCCTDLLIDMQGQVEQGNWLKLLLAASPFILVLPDIIPARSAREAAEMVAEKMALLTADKALANINKGKAKPDFADAVKSVDVMILGTLNRVAFAHSFKHLGTKVQYVWQNLAAAYTLKIQIKSGAAPTKENSASWSFFQ